MWLRLPSFASTYEYRAFQLLPALKELDPSRAEDVLRENSHVQVDLQRFPDGMQSLSATYGESPTSGREKAQGPQVSFPSLDAIQPPLHAIQQELQTQIRQLQAKVRSETEADPKRALSDALALPLHDAYIGDWETSPRASTLMSIAVATAKKDSAISKSALTELLKLADETSFFTQIEVIGDVPRIYLQMGDEDDARNAIKSLTEVADRLYVRDTDVDDPNLAFKWRWPSTSMWGRCIDLAAKLSPDLAEAIIIGISDPEIVAVEKVFYANSLLGATKPGLTPVEQINKQGMGGTASD